MGAGCHLSLNKHAARQESLSFIIGVWINNPPLKPHLRKRNNSLMYRMNIAVKGGEECR